MSQKCCEGHTIRAVRTSGVSAHSQQSKHPSLLILKSIFFQFPFAFYNSLIGIFSDTNVGHFFHIATDNWGLT